MIRPEDLGQFLDGANPETQVLYADNIWRPVSGGGGGTVTSVGLDAPSGEFAVTFSPVTTSGTLTLSWVDQAAKKFLAGPVSGADAAPSFRAIEPTDLAGTPGAGKYWDGTGTWTTLPAPGSGTVTSVGLNAPSGEILVSNSPVTTSGTLALTWVAQNANEFFAGPTGGPVGTPAFRALVNADFPASGVSAGSYTYSSITVNAQGIVTAASSGAAPTGTVTSVGLAAPTELTVTNSPVTTSGTLTLAWASQPDQNFVFATPDGAPGVPAFRALVQGDIPALPYVASVGLAAPGEFQVTNSPVTGTGTLTLAWVTQAQNLVFASQASGVGVPAFRSLVAADLPNTTVTPGSYTYASLTVDAQGRLTAASSGAAPTGTVTSVGLAAPAEFNVTNSPVTVSGTLTLAWANATANRVFAGPNTGSPGTPAFRALVAADLPSTTVVAGSYTYAAITVDAQGRLTAASSGAAPTGTVTSVGFAAPAQFLVTNSPVTTTGTLTIAWVSQSANTFLSGPTTGAAAAPTFRTVVAEDLATGTPTTGYIAQSAGAATKPVWASPPTILGVQSISYINSIALDMNSVSDSFDVPGLVGSNHTSLSGVALTDIITDNAHGYANGTRVILSSLNGGAGLAINRQYYVITATTNTYQLSLSVGGAAINFTTDITAGTTIRSVGSLSITIPAGSPSTVWAAYFQGLVAVANASASRGLGLAFVLSTNVNVSPGNSALLWPIGYASNAASPYYSGNTVDVATQTIPLQYNIGGAIFSASAGQTVKIVVSARNVFALNTWTNRDFIMTPLA